MASNLIKSDRCVTENPFAIKARKSSSGSKFSGFLMQIFADTPAKSSSW